MNALTRARTRLAALMGGRPATVAPRARSLADMLGPSAPRALVASDFAAGNHLPNVPSEVGAATIPRGDVHSLAVNVPIRAYLFARASLGVTTGIGETTAALDLGTLGLAMARSTRTAPSLPATGHPDVRAYTAPNGGSTWTERSITAVDFDAGTLTIGGLTAETAYDVRVFFLPAAGAVRIRAVQPSGIDERSIELYNDSLRGLHETDQAQADLAPRMKRAGLSSLPVGPKWRIAIEATTPATFAWGDPLNPSEVRLPGNRAPVVVNDEAALNAALTAALRSA